MPNSLIQVPFQGATVACAIIDGVPYVAMRPLCDALEVTWPRQMRAIKADPVLSSTVAEMATVGADGKTRSMLCLPLDYLNGWLFKIDAGRYKPGDPRRDRIVAYQRECYQVLHSYFTGEPMATRRAGSGIVPAALDRRYQRALEKHVAQLQEWGLSRGYGRFAMLHLVSLAYAGRRWEYTGTLAERWMLSGGRAPYRKLLN